MSYTLGNFGEKKLLQSLKKYLGKSGKIIRNFSEDCAVIETSGRSYELFTTDSMIEGIHFKSEYMPAYFIGRKAVKVNLSDISAMGGKPVYCMVSLGAPDDMKVTVLDEIYSGMRSVFREEGIRLIGGNVASSPVLFLDLFVTGTVLKNQILLRNGAREGDSIFVTGNLGSSAQGLRLLKKGFRVSKNGKKVITPHGGRDSRHVRQSILSHFDPPSLNVLARKLAQLKMLTSMVDLSDGLASDLREICRESRKGALIDLRRIPVSPAVAYWQKNDNRDPLALALCGGEDYHLLFTVSHSVRERFLRSVSRDKLKVYEIGTILNQREGIWAIAKSGKKVVLPKGFEHFHEN
jgi:thiamine-monophosphate kinase